MKAVMSGLLFPAFLGTGLVLVVMELITSTEPTPWLALAFALPLSVYYCLAFSVLQKNITYKLLHFILDLLISFLALYGFILLGFGTSTASSPNVTEFFRIIAIAIILELVWAFVAGRLTWLRALVGTGSAAGLFIVSLFMPLHTAILFALATILLGLVFLYGWKTISEEGA